MSTHWATISPCPECGGSGQVRTGVYGPEEPMWRTCEACRGTGEHVCTCVVHPECAVHGGDSVRVDMTPELWARLPRRAES